MLPVQIDHTQQALDRLLWQWRNSDNLKNLIQSYTDNINTLEDVYFDLLDNRNIDNGEGHQLDVIGLLIGEPRQFRNDIDYRKALKAKSLIARSSGTPPELLMILEQLTEADTVNLWEHYPGNVHLYATGGVSAFTVLSMDQVIPAGVSMKLMFDEGGNSFVGSELVNAPFILIDNNTNIFQVNDQFLNPFDLQVIGIGEAAAASEKSILPELFVEGYMRHYEASFTGTTEFTESLVVFNQRAYAISYNVTGMTTGSVQFEIRGGTTVSGQVTTDNGVVNEVLITKSGNNEIAIVPSVDFDGTVEDFSFWLIPKTTDLQNPLCEVIDKDISTESFSFIVTDDDDFIVNEDDDNFIALL